MQPTKVFNPVCALFSGEPRQATLSDAIEAFLRIETTGKSPQTTDWYRRRLSLLVEEIGGEQLLSELMEADLFEWYARLDRRTRRYASGDAPPPAGSLAVETLHGYVRACKRLFKWLYQENVLPVNLAGRLKLPKLPKRLRKGISEQNASAILESAQGNARDYALLCFLESTGCRRG